MSYWDHGGQLLFSQDVKRYVMAAPETALNLIVHRTNPR
jgi:hypothetical protein